MNTSIPLFTVLCFLTSSALAREVTVLSESSYSKVTTQTHVFTKLFEIQIKPEDCQLTAPDQRAYFVQTRDCTIRLSEMPEFKEALTIGYTLTANQNRFPSKFEERYHDEEGTPWPEPVFFQFENSRARVWISTVQDRQDLLQIKVQSFNHADLMGGFPESAMHPSWKPIIQQNRGDVDAAIQEDSLVARVLIGMKQVRTTRD